MKEFTVRAAFDSDAGVWVGSSPDLPLTTEADTLDLLLERVEAIAPEIAAENGLADEGEQITLHFTTDRLAVAS